PHWRALPRRRDHGRQRDQPASARSPRLCRNGDGEGDRAQVRPLARRDDGSAPAAGPERTGMTDHVDRRGIPEARFRCGVDSRRRIVPPGPGPWRVGVTGRGSEGRRVARVTEYAMRVLATDMDSDLIVNNARFFEYFQEARLEH